MVKVERLAAIHGGKKVEIEYLGFLLWSTVSDILKIPTEDLKEALTDVGLEKFMPRPVNPHHAFRRVTKDLETKKAPHGKDTYVNLLVREVKYEGKEVVRQLVREIVDSENKRLDYKPVVNLEIGKEGRLAITPLVADLLDIERRVIERLPNAHAEALEHYDGTHIRHMFRDIMGHCNPVSVRPNGGVIFVPHKYASTVEAAKALGKRLNGYAGNVKIWNVPVIDAHEHREMLEESLEEQIMNGSLRLIEEMKAAMEDSSREPTPRMAQGFVERVKKLKESVAEYEELLETQATKARANLELALAQAVKMLEIASEDTPNTEEKRGE